MNTKKSFKGADVFPKEASRSVERIRYPEKNFKFWASNENVIVFVPFMDEHRKIYFCRHLANEKNLSGLPYMGKECQKFDSFHPESIEWTSIANRYRRNPQQKFRKNADVRMSFMVENQFLVKAYFTFGLRTVREGTVHLIQTLNVPVLFYLLPKTVRRSQLSREDKVFHYDNVHLFDRRILLADGAYAVPPGTTYMLFTTQKTFFTLDLLASDFPIPFPTSDPVAQRVARLDSSMDYPPETPYIDDERDQDEDEDEDEDRAAMPPPPLPRSEPLTLYFPQSEPGPSSAPSRFPPQKRGWTEEEMELEEFFERAPKNPRPEEAPQQQVTYWLIPNPPILERSVFTAPLDFVKNYRILNSKVFDDPREDFFRSEEPDPEPLDLTVRRNAECVDLTGETPGVPDGPEKTNDGASSFEDVDFADHPQVDRSHSEEYGLDLDAMLDMPFDPKGDVALDKIISDLYNSSPGMNSDLCPSVF